MTEAPRRRPDFVGVGVQRSGTTFLQRCLQHHPEIGKPQNGLHFFSHDAGYNPELEGAAPLDLAWYERQLGRFADRKVVGEFSVTYGFSENRERCADLIREHYPEVKILIALRNPVERAVSEYGKARQGMDIPKGTSLARFAEEHPLVVERGRYAPLLETYFARFPRERVFVAVFDDMRADRDAYVASLYGFLGVDASFRPELGNPNPSRPIRFDAVEKGIRLLQDAVRPLKAGPLSFVHRGLKASGVREWLRRRNVEEGVEVTDDERAALAALYRDDILRVETLLARDLSTWR